jgi:hypothetical protein
MRYVKLTAGAVRVRGYGEPEITVKRAGDGAFAVARSLAARLTRQGIAEYADAPEAAQAPEKPEYSEANTSAELKALMDAADLPYKKSAAKDRLIAALDEYYNQ